MASLPFSTTGTDADEFCASIHGTCTVNINRSVNSTMLMLIPALLALPASTSDSERCFPMVPKIDSEDRSHLECTTVASLLALKPIVLVLSYKRPCLKYTNQQRGNTMSMVHAVIFESDEFYDNAINIVCV